MTGLVLDAGAFIAWERGDVTVRARLEAARRLGIPIRSPSPVVAQVWRNGARQALLSMLLGAIDVSAPDLADAQSAGALCGKARTSDVVDALVVAAASNGSTIVTSDPADIGVLIAAAGRRIDVVRV